VGGGSNAAGLFYPFVDEAGVELLGAEAGGKGVESGLHAATISCGDVGVLHGSKSYLLQDDAGQVIEPYSISAGLDYPGVGPEHSYWAKIGRAKYAPITDAEALEAFHLLAKCEGILPALESSHAIALAIKEAKKRSKDEIVLVCLSGRGDKDLEHIIQSEQLS
jgi:tryptophan synthase beta chain